MASAAGKGLRLAVEGCGHGTLHSIYASVQKACEEKGWDRVDILIIGGDFQSVRNAHDLTCASIPPKYWEIGDFHEYYSGARTAPYLTMFVGGNHEASNYLWELYYGGWVAPNIYYVGAANVVRLGGLRIAGLSGIWKGYDYKKPHFERLPYNNDDKKSIFHVRELDVRKLLQICTQVDVGISHDWPRGVEWNGDWRTLFRTKPFLEPDARDGSLGSVAARLVLDRLRPRYWFSAHLHVKYAATIRHDDRALGRLPPSARDVGTAGEPALPSGAPRREDRTGPVVMGDDSAAPDQVLRDPPTNADEIDLNLEDAPPPTERAEVRQTAAASGAITDAIRAQLPAAFTRPKPDQTEERGDPSPPVDIKNKVTNFLALDKCLPSRDFLQLLEIKPPDGSYITEPLQLEYDKEWLAITRVFANELSLGHPAAGVPQSRGEEHYRPLIEREENWVEEHLVRAGRMVVPGDFQMTAPPYDPVQGLRVGTQPREYSNPHTQAFCALLQIPNPFHASDEDVLRRMDAGPRPDAPRIGGGGRGRSPFRARGSRGRGSGGGFWSRGRGRGRGRG